MGQKTQAEALLRSETVTQVGLYGNADVQNPNDWLEIEYSFVPAATTLANETGARCEDLPTHVTLQVLVTDQGSTRNPQARVIGVRVVTNLTSWRWDPSVSGEDPRPLEVYNAVQFIAIHEDVLAKNRRATPRPEPACRHSVCSSQWFYPLKWVFTDVTASNPDKWNQQAAAWGLLCLFIALPLVWVRTVQRRNREAIYG